jgi:hypothetical protein
MMATDLNGDGLPDLVVLDKNGYVQVLMNKTQVVNPPIAFDLAPRQEASGNDFANGQVAPIYGTVFEDSNGNGSLDAGESGIGATVFLDANNNGVLDPGELSTTTDANGTYAFPNVPDGTYHVRVVPEPGRLLTGPAGGAQALTVSNGRPSRIGAYDFGSVLAWLEDIRPVTVDDGAPSTFTVSSTAAGAGRPLQFSLVPGAPAAAYIDASTGLFTWTPTGAEGPGSYPVTVRVTDASTPGRTEDHSFTVTVQATPPYQFVRALYRDVLNRAPDAAGLQGWVDRLQAGASRLDVATGIWDSAEHRGLEVDRLYTTFLHRAADPDGRAVWANALASGMSEAAVALAFLTSPEYQQAHPDPDSFVRGLYGDVLGRAADQAGLDDWVNQLQTGGSRAQVAQGFEESAEHRGRQADQLYDAFLHRAADPDGRTAWASPLANGLSEAGAALAFLSCDEYWLTSGDPAAPK